MENQITNAKEWWDAVDENWEHLTDIVAHVMNMFHAAYENPGDAKSPPTGRKIMDELEHLRKTRDRRLARYFSAAWCMCSDAYAWSVPAWGTFCDLCSEEGVLWEENNDQQMVMF